ncbi:MAG TPA: hypothetical protein ENI23_08540 [bacterium]|nr:hypothetical protein [bacterium]
MSTRLRSILVTAVASISFLLLQLLDFNLSAEAGILESLLRSLIISFIVFIGIYWVVNFKIKIDRVLPILTFPALLIFVISFFAELIIFTSLDGAGEIGFLIASAIVLSVFVYVAVLTANILNVSVASKIPLGQAGRAAQYVLVLLASYLGFFILFSVGLIVFIRLPAIFLFTLFLSYSSFWTIELKNKESVLSSLILSFIVLFAATVLVIWPLSVGYVSLMLSMIMYMGLGVGLEIREKITGYVWVEYSLLFIVMIIIALLFASFGINGTLL